MVGQDDETKTAGPTSSDPALDVTLPASSDATPQQSAGQASDLPPGSSIGRYRVLDVLGRGGMGVVYRARDPDLDRELALKVVLPGSAAPRAQKRLLEEARAMAKLRHPSVVPVFDVGSTERGVYIVMPLVSGGTVYDWLRAAKRSWPEVLDCFLAAGRGLVAAHDAGLIHRDLKPRNILVSDAGEVLVADFGIAARADESNDPMSGTPGSAQVSSIAGTPAYMAPEQAASSTIDARADQYSFCISLWEGLCGERPTDAETRTAGGAGRLLDSGERKRGDAPAWLLRAVARGFSAAPERRWPSMAALIAHIEARRARPKKLAFLTLGAVIAAGSAGLVLIAPGSNADPCRDATGRLAGVWSPSVRARVEAAFSATGVSYASESLSRVIPAVERYAKEWRTARIETCRAGLVTRSQSAELHDRRVMCLERHLDVLRARAELFRDVDVETLPRAIELVESLPPLSDCSDITTLLAGVPTPSEPKARARIVDIERRIRDLDTFALRGAPKEVLERATALADEARGIGHPPTLVMALRTLSEAQRSSGMSAETALRELAEAAAHARDDGALATAWSSLVHDLALARQLKEARALEPVAEAALTRAGAAQPLVFRVNSDLGARAYAEDDHDLAIARYETALAAASTPSERRSALTSLASALRASMKIDRALPLIEEAVEVAEDAHGMNHPAVADALEMLAVTLQATGRAEDLTRASAVLERALEIRTAAFGAESQQAAKTLSVMASTATQRGGYAEADTVLRRAIAIVEPKGDSLLLGKLYRRLGDNVTFLESFDAARPHFARALSIMSTVVGTSNMEYVASSLNYAVELSDRGECDAALPYAKNAVDVLEPQGHPYVASAFLIFGKCGLAAKRNQEGFEWLEKALSTCERAKCHTGYLEDVQWYLGSTLVETGTDRKRGVELVKKSREGFRALSRTEAVEFIDDWLTKNGR